MNIKEFANRLDGREYGNEVTSEERAFARKNNWLIVTGASDDLVELDGVINDELGACDGGSWLLDSEGILSPFEDVESAEAAEEWLRLKEKAHKLEAFWKNESPPWSFKWHGPQPVAEFMIMDEHEPFCRGLIIDFGKEGE